MLALLKLLQSLIKTLHSDGTPGQIAAGIALGAALGLTPLVTPQNFLIFCLLVLLNVSFAAGMLGWALAMPVGFLLDPAFNWIGRVLLESDALRPLWTVLTNTPVVPFTDFNNTVTLGSFVAWVLLFVPIYLGARVGVIRYRASWGEKIRRSELYHAIRGSKLYNVYRWFRPEWTQ